MIDSHNKLDKSTDAWLLRRKILEKDLRENYSIIENTPRSTIEDLSSFGMITIGPPVVEEEPIKCECGKLRPLGKPVCSSSISNVSCEQINNDDGRNNAVRCVSVYFFIIVSVLCSLELLFQKINSTDSLCASSLRLCVNVSEEKLVEFIICLFP